MKFSNALPLIFVSAVSLFATTAFAEDFTFTVPANFNNLPPVVTRAEVNCNALNSSIGSEVANRGTSVAITDGAYHGDVTIRFDASPGVDPATATHYNCTASFIGSSGVRYFYRPGGPTFPLEPGAPFLLDTRAQPITR